MISIQSTIKIKLLIIIIMLFQPSIQIVSGTLAQDITTDTKYFNLDSFNSSENVFNMDIYDAQLVLNYSISVTQNSTSQVITTVQLSTTVEYLYTKPGSTTYKNYTVGTINISINTTETASGTIVVSYYIKGLGIPTPWSFTAMIVALLIVTKRKRN